MKAALTLPVLLRAPKIVWPFIGRSVSRKRQRYSFGRRHPVPHYHFVRASATELLRRLAER
jgi:hypothetical protein